MKLAVPRNADGTVNQTTLLNDVRAQFAAGTTEIQFRGATAQDAQLLVDQKLFSALRPLLPNDGVERSVRLRGAFDARLQRNEEGELRARIEGINLGTLSPAQRAELARQLASQAGLDRIRIRGVDATGARVRIEFRDERRQEERRPRRPAQNGAQRAQPASPQSPQRQARNDNARNAKPAQRAVGTRRRRAADRRATTGGARGDRAERAERPERAARAERVERVERPERAERVERVERPERTEARRASRAARALRRQQRPRLERTKL